MNKKLILMFIFFLLPSLTIQIPFVFYCRHALRFSPLLTIISFTSFKILKHNYFEKDEPAIKYNHLNQHNRLIKISDHQNAELSEIEKKNAVQDLIVLTGLFSGFTFLCLALKLQ